VMRKRRGNIYERSGSVWLRIRVEESGRDNIRLGSIGELRSSEARRRAADQWIGRHLPECLTTDITVGSAQYFETWLQKHAAFLRPSTRSRYESTVRRHLIPELGSIPLPRIDVAAIRSAHANWSAWFARSTVSGYRSVLLAILRRARVDGFDAPEINPRHVRLPAIVETRREPRYINAAELCRILEASDIPQRAAYALMSMAGLRCSEALALTWEHVLVDSGEPLLLIRQSTRRGKLYPLKSKASRADLPMLPDLAAILREYRSAWQPNSAGLLFATSKGRPWNPDHLRARHWTQLLQRLGIAHTGLHALRHGYPSRLFKAGVSVPIVQRLMRHADSKQTEHYTHSSAEDLRAAVERASNLHRALQP
jgi:integrase